MSRFYISTPIYYINAEPHLGHAYTTMAADAAARAHRLLGEDVFFLTGTDEHGQKVERAAAKAGLPPEAFAERVSQKFRELSGLLNISNDDFIRTTEPRHFAAAQALWRRVRERGYIYKGQYEGWYCTVDEVFVPDTQLVDGRCPICGNAVERIAEESYFFRLSAFESRLREHYDAHPDFVTPQIRRNEVRAFVDGGLQDLSISRTSFKWGIPVPDDPSHVMYVWFDALTNYMTAVGYGASSEASSQQFARYWPADVHLIGKEIVRQHAVYWPAFLMAADLPLPNRIVSHGWWLMDGAKMSKSLGNVVRPDAYVKQFGVDGLRYFVLREMVFGQDASFGDEAFLKRYNADLANDLGNLVSRAISMIHRYCQGAMPSAAADRLHEPPEQELGKALDALVANARSFVEAFQFGALLRELWEVISAANRYIVIREPWVLAKDPGKRVELETALYVSADAVRIIAELVRPFMPATGERTLRMLGIEPGARSWETLQRNALVPGRPLGQTEQLFPRIDHSVEELRHMSDEQQAGSAPVSSPSGQPSSATPGPAAAATAPPVAPASGDRLSIDDFMKVELRVAKVLAAERVPNSKKLIKMQVDVGSEQRTIVAGIAEAYEAEALVGRSVVIVFNLKPAKLMGIESSGMVLAASPDGGKPMLLGFDEAPPPGTRVR